MPVDGPLYPVNLRVEGRSCLVVGGGRVAAGKVQGLLEAGAVVDVVAPQIEPELCNRDDLVTFERPYTSGDLEGRWLVITATDDPEVNARVAADATERGLWVNSADDPANCSFTLPARVRRGDLLIAVSTGGRSPAMASWVRRWLEDELGPQHERLLEVLADVREQLRADGIATESLDWQSAVDSGTLELIHQGHIREAKERLQACLLSSSG
jgi:precorrin-2 dehydrogenase/sirohydrochlorin ferrochelatase